MKRLNTSMPSQTGEAGQLIRAGRGKQYAIAVAILLLGAVLRLAAFGETLIEPDQASILDAAFQTAQLRYFPLIGMKSSVGVMQTGFLPLLAAFPLLFVKRIIAVQWFLSALDLLTLAWLHRTVRKAIGWRAACITALLYATAPWVILYARTIWYQTLIASLATVAFGSLLLLLTPRSTEAYPLPLAMVSITALSMVHLAAAPWGAMLMLLCLGIAWRKQLGRAFVIGMVLSGLITLPYLIYLARTSFSDLAFIVSTGQSSRVLNTAAYRLSAELITGSMILPNIQGNLWDRAVIEWPSAYYIFLAALAAAFTWAIASIAKKSHQRQVLLLTVLWLIVVPTLFLRTNVHLQHFYLMSLFPAPFVLIGAWIESLTRSRRSSVPSFPLTILGQFTTGVLLLISLWWASLWLIRIDLEAKGELQRDMRGWVMDRAADTVTTYLTEEPDGNFIVLTDFGGDLSSFDWLRGYTRSDRVRMVPIRKGFVIPNKPTCFLVGPQVPPETLQLVPGFVERLDLQIPGNPPWSVYCGHHARPSATRQADWNNGLSLLATEVTGEFSPGSELHITHTWTYQSVNPGPYHFYNHLLLEGTMIAQVDGASVQHWHWRDGDTLLTYFTLALPNDMGTGDYTLRVGLYTWPDMERNLLTTGEDGFNAFTATY
jgi:hypothetical protein